MQQVYGENVFMQWAGFRGELADGRPNVDPPYFHPTDRLVEIDVFDEPLWTQLGTLTLYNAKWMPHNVPAALYRWQPAASEFLPRWTTARTGRWYVEGAMLHLLDDTLKHSMTLEMFAGSYESLHSTSSGTGTRFANVQDDVTVSWQIRNLTQP